MSSDLYTGSLSQRINFAEKLVSTRSADLYRAIDKVNGTALWIWTFRHSLTPDSPASQRFVSRMQTLQSLSRSICEITSCGVDADGIAYAVIPPRDGRVLSPEGLSANEAERISISSIKLIDALHKVGVVCGDICDGSFWLSREKNLSFIGVMGSFDAEAMSTAAAPPSSTFHYLSPEQRGGAGIEYATDVFALGVLTHYLISKKYPLSDQDALLGKYAADKITKISETLGIQYRWLDDVLVRCLSTTPSERYPNAGAILQGIGEARSRAAEDSKSKAPIAFDKDPAQDKKSSSMYLHGAPLGAKAAQEVETEKEVSKDSFKLNKKKLAVFAIVLLFGGYFLLARGKKKDETLSHELNIHKGATSDEQMKEAINTLNKNDASLNEIEANMRKLAASEDPLAYHLMVKASVDAKTPEERIVIEKIIIERLKRKNFQRTADELEQFFYRLNAANRTLELPGGYESILELANPDLPTSAKKDILKGLLEISPIFAVRVLSANALDSTPGDYRVLIAQAMGYLPELKGERSALALIFANPDTGPLYAVDIMQRRDEISDQDVYWMLQQVIDGDPTRMRMIVGVVANRPIIDPLRRSFLNTIEKREDIPTEVMRSAMRSITDTLTVDDVRIFGGWADLESENLLLGVLAMYRDSKMLESAFDAVAAKTLNNKAAAALFEWVKANQWENRIQFAHLVGVVAFSKDLEQEVIEKALEEVKEFTKKASFLDALLANEDPSVALIVAKKYGKDLSFAALVRFLKNPNKDLKKLAISYLKDYNDLAVLKIIIDNYEEEKDPEIKQLYRDNFWAIRERG